MTDSDLNMVVVRGRLATEPELRQYDSGARYMRCLVTAGTVQPGSNGRPHHRIDVIPVVYWDPTDDLVDLLKGQSRVWVVGAVQRRSVDGPEGRRSRIEVVAEAISVVYE